MEVPKEIRDLERRASSQKSRRCEVANWWCVVAEQPERLDEGFISPPVSQSLKLFEQVSSQILRALLILNSGGGQSFNCSAMGA